MITVVCEQYLEHSDTRLLQHSHEVTVSLFNSITVWKWISFDLLNQQFTERWERHVKCQQHCSVWGKHGSSPLCSWEWHVVFDLWLRWSSDLFPSGEGGSHGGGRGGGGGSREMKREEVAERYWVKINYMVMKEHGSVMTSQDNIQTSYCHMCSSYNTLFLHTSYDIL